MKKTMVTVLTVLCCICAAVSCATVDAVQPIDGASDSFSGKNWNAPRRNNMYDRWEFNPDGTFHFWHIHQGTPLNRGVYQYEAKEGVIAITKAGTDERWVYTYSFKGKTVTLTLAQEAAEPSGASHLMGALPVFPNGAKEDSTAPFNDHDIVAVHRIHLREVVRIGVLADNAPFSFQGAKGAWQGYDVYFARRIAREILDNKEKYLRLIPVTRENWTKLLESDEVDFVLPGFVPDLEQSAAADFALPYRRADGEAIAPAVRKGNDGLVLWLNDVISRRIEADFFHKDYEVTLRPVYGKAGDPRTIIIENGRIE